MSYGRLGSSVNPEELSLTISSIVKLLGVILSAYATMQGIDGVIDNEQVQQLVDACTIIATSVFAIYHSANIVFGLFRKIAVRF